MDLLHPDVKTQTKIIKQASFACFSWKPVKLPLLAIRCPAHLCAGYSKLPGDRNMPDVTFAFNTSNTASLTTTVTHSSTHTLRGFKSDSDCSQSQETFSLRSTFSCLIPSSVLQLKTVSVNVAALTHKKPQLCAAQMQCNRNQNNLSRTFSHWHSEKLDRKDQQLFSHLRDRRTQWK